MTKRQKIYINVCIVCNTSIILQKNALFCESNFWWLEVLLKNIYMYQFDTLNTNLRTDNDKYKILDNNFDCNGVVGEFIDISVEWS